MVGYLNEKVSSGFKGGSFYGKDIEIMNLVHALSIQLAK